MKLIPKDKAGRFGPKKGWKERTWYECEVSFSDSNPVHKCLLYTGFLNGHDRTPKSGKTPGAYNLLINPSWEQTHKYHDAYYLKPIRKIDIKLR